MNAAKLPRPTLPPQVAGGGPPPSGPPPAAAGGPPPPPPPGPPHRAPRDGEPLPGPAGRGKDMVRELARRAPAELSGASRAAAFEGTLALRFGLRAPSDGSSDRGA